MACQRVSSLAYSQWKKANVISRGELTLHSRNFDVVVEDHHKIDLGTTPVQLGSLAASAGNDEE
ncbi:MAG: hypothetical protein ACK5YO_29205, partial [Planctomyces sp.]